MLHNLATGVNTSDGSLTVQWPANIPSNGDKYQLVFTNYSTDSIVSHSDSFVLTGEVSPGSGGLSTGDKAAIGVCIPVGVLLILALCWYMHRLNKRRNAKQSGLEQEDRPSHKAELEGSSRFTSFWHRIRPELGSRVEAAEEKPTTIAELPNGPHNERLAVNSSPVELASPTSPTSPHFAREAMSPVSPVELPSPSTPEPNTINGVLNRALYRPTSPKSEKENLSSGSRPNTGATAASNGVSMMLAKAKNQEECSEITTTPAGIIVTRKPIGTCRKEVPHSHIPADSTISTSSSTMVGSAAELRHDQQFGNEIGIGESMPRRASAASDVKHHPHNWDGSEWDHSMGESSTSALDAKHDARPAREQLVENTADDFQHAHDKNDGNEAEDEMTKPPEGDIF